MPGRRGAAAPRWRRRLRGMGYRMTVPRQAIIDVLAGTDKHLSAEDIYMKVHRIYPHVGLTTVYRTLELLTEAGLVLKYDFGDGRARYELKEGPEKEHHHHLICTCCKKVVNYSDFMDEEKEFLKRVEKGLEKKHDFQIRDHLIQFYGLCAKCRQRNK